jgi:hypothetical protein
MSISELLGETLVGITQESNDKLIFVTATSRTFEMYHDQDCCESVYIEDIAGNLEDLLHSPILMAEEVSQEDENADESGTWTFYKLATVKGYVTIRWYGYSNGYYSEDVDFVEIKSKEIH